MADSPFLTIPAQPPIGDYAAIGNCRTLALASKFGSIDWLCVPHFSGPSVFAALMDRERGGAFSVRPRGVQHVEQRYREGTNIVETTFRCDSGVLKLIDLMALPEPDTVSDDACQRPHVLVRIAQCVEGFVALEVRCSPCPNYGRDRLDLSHPPEAEGTVWTGQWPQGVMRLSTTHALNLQGNALLAADVTLQAEQTFSAVLELGATALPAPLPDAHELLALTEQHWRQWVGRCRYTGPYAHEVRRSALTLKLLNYWPSGAVVAAGTTSIPEGPHGHRNWDYRYCWLRDTSLVLQAFMDLGYLAESCAFLAWLLKAAKASRPKVSVLYTVLGAPPGGEQTLAHLRGYRGIGPVRIGNDAMHQRQLDIYGELLVTADDFVSRGGRLSAQEQALLEGFVDVVCELWREPDEGIWEVRSGPRHNTHSKVMCWVGLDRALHLQSQGHLQLDTARVRAQRDAIRQDIEARGYSPALNSYVGYYGAEDTDASLLLMPRLGYLPARDPRMLGTVEQIKRQLSVKGLLYRYPPGPAYDGVPGQENLFCICSFWMVECLARQGCVQEARELFERLLQLRNHVGLYAEEFSVQDLQAVGNFPQAFSHVGLITAALALQAAR